MTNCIEIKGLCKSYGDFALNNIDLTLPGGSILGLIGENGAGKTTTIKCILNLIRRDAGEIALLGYDNIKEEQLAKQDIGMVLDECFFHDTLRPRDVGKILAPAYQNWDQGLFRDYLSKFGLPEKKFIKEFSRGMKMKLSLSAALAHQPKLLILDEATAGLDPVVRDEILDEFLGFIQDEDHAILISSHITSDLEKVADYIAYLHQGKLLLCDEKDRLLESYGRLVCAREELAQVDRGYVVATRKSQYSTEALIRRRGDFKRLYPRLTVEPVTLDELMVFVVKGERA